MGDAGPGFASDRQDRKELEAEVVRWCAVTPAEVGRNTRPGDTERDLGDTDRVLSGDWGKCLLRSNVVEAGRRLRRLG